MATRAPTAHGQRRRQRIVAAAAERFDRDGFHGASIDDIGAAAGISGSGVYRHFESKDALLLAVFDRVWERLRPVVAEATERDPEDAISSLIDAHVAFAIDDAPSLRLLIRELRHVPERYRRAVARNHRVYVDAWVGPLRRLDPSRSEDDARSLALAAHGLIDSAATHPQYVDPADRSEMLRTAARRLLLG